ncbi:RluA family pseudouridine synthase [Rhodospirillaceae bacterium]|nr:RluA family pseudouridine synthase [Rhodospirillaceae bacterium]
MGTFSATRLEISVEETDLNSNRTVRLDRWLTDRIAGNPDFPKISRTQLKNLIQNKCVSCDRKIIEDPSLPVRYGQLYTIEIPEPKPAVPQAENIDLNIVYEDQHLIVINKPAGMVVHPAPGSIEGTLVNALLSHCGNTLSGIGGVRRPGIVHRLDKDTTGLIVVAKSDEAHQHLVHQFAARTIKRTYEAAIWGVPDKPADRIYLPIGRSRINRKKMAVVQQGGKPAATNYVLEEQFGTIASLIVCKLESGRTHQIRVHLNYIGNSIIGDPLYGGSKKISTGEGSVLNIAHEFRRQALHAKSLEFIHPSKQDPVRFSAPLPYDMQTLVEALRQTSGV